ncbi:MAG: alcohol dehydrogenase catalytic domain-containing protein [Bacillota bacterium]|jgi:propanol-preferring alcohol dehydrogenase
MKAARIYVPGEDLRIDEIPKPQLKKGHALIKVKAAGVCGSELDFVEGIFPFTPPFILGHEISGIVEEIDGDDFKPGDKVVVYNYKNCGVCKYCRNDMENMCPNNSGQFGFTVDGGFAEYVLVPIQNLVPLPENLSFEEGAVLACSGLTAVHSTRRAGTKMGDIVAVDGVGGVGIMCIQIAKIVGATVIAIADSEAKAELAKNVGADHVILANENYDNISKEIMELTNNDGVQVYYVLSGTSAAYTAGIESVSRGGKVVIIGYQKDNNINFYPVGLMVKEGQIISSVAGCKKDVQLALHFASKGQIKVVIENRFPLEKINEAIQLLIERKAKGRSVIVFD